MPTKEKLESALRNAHKAGDVAAARVFANALKNGQYDQPEPAEPAQAQPKNTMQELDEAFLSLPGGKAIAEFASAANRSIFDMVDFFGPDSINAALELAGSDKRVPTARQALGSDGGYMEPGLARDAIQAAGETAPMAVAVGQGLRSIAGKLPAAAPGESAARGVVRQMGQGTAGQDAAAGTLAGVGSAIGEDVGGETGKMIGSVAGGLTGGLLMPAKEAAVETIRRAFRGGEAGRKSFQAAIDDFAEAGTTPTFGQASPEGFRQGVENLSARLLGGGPIREAVKKTSDAMQRRLATIADDISRTTGDVEAGRAIQRGITGPGGFVDRFQAQSGQLWGKFDSLIDDAAPVSASKTQAALDKLVNTSEFGKVLNNPLVSQIKKLLDDAGGQMDYRTFRELRSAVGQKLGSNDLISDIPRAQLKQLYGALSQDLKGVASQYGDDAVRALGRANKYTSAGHSRMDDFVERIATKVDLDQVFNAVTKGGEGIQAINAVKRSLKPGEWEVVASNVVRKLGQATSGQQDDVGSVFSVNKFLTDWNKLGRAKNVLFSGSQKLNSYRDNLDKIASAADRFKMAAQTMQNPSGTGQFLANVGTMTAGGTSLVTGMATGNFVPFGMVLTSVAANSAAAKLMSSPKFVNWLARGVDTKNWPTHIARLTTIASTPEEVEAIGSLLESLDDRGKQMPEEGADSQEQ